MDPSKIREKIGRFRILIIGRANAGKTTILQRVCNTRDNPEIFNSAGKKVNPAVLTASRERGLHDIENEMVFRSNPGFVFHDSRGFEAGGESEFDMVKAFIVARSKETRIRNQLHAIWYCIPMDEASRSFTEGEIKFFSQCDTGSIPVMVLFTKFDALYKFAYSELKSKGASREQARELAPKHAEESFVKGPQLKFLYHSKDIRRPPKCHVFLPNMDHDDADCGSLIERTAGTLHNEVLQQLFVSTQRTNLELCMKYAVERTLPTLFDFDSAETPASQGHKKTIGKLGVWFPHLWVYGYEFFVFREEEGGEGRRVFEDELGINVTEDIDESHREEMLSRLLSVASGSSPLETVVQLSSAVVIIFEHSFYIFDKRHHLQDQQKSVPSIYVALEQYMASPHATAVREGVSAAVQAYEEAVTTAARAYEEAVSAAVYTNQGTLPALMAKLPFEHFKRKSKQSFERSKEKEKDSSCSQAMVEFIETILKITLDHRLPRL